MTAARTASRAVSRPAAMFAGSTLVSPTRSTSAASTGTSGTPTTRSSAASLSDGRSQLVDELQLAWCAGVIDVMGLIRTRAMKTGAELCYVGVSTAKRDVLAELSGLTGVRVMTVNRDYNRLGCGEHCTEAHLHVYSSTGRWSLTGSRAVVFLSAIEPHLKLQRGRALDVIAAGRIAPHKPATLRKMYELGWPELAA